MMSHTSGAILQKPEDFLIISEHYKEPGSGHESLVKGTQHCPLVTNLGFPPPAGSIFLNIIT